MNEADGSALVLILALIGGWFILVGAIHALLYVLWRLGVPFPESWEKHLTDEWGQR